MVAAVSAERDLLLALLTRLYQRKTISAADLASLAEDMCSYETEDHGELAKQTRSIIFREAPESKEADPETWVRHRRRQMRLRTQWIENKMRGEADEEVGGE